MTIQTRPIKITTIQVPTIEIRQLKLGFFFKLQQFKLFGCNIDSLILIVMFELGNIKNLCVLIKFNFLNLNKFVFGLHNDIISLIVVFSLSDI